MARANYAHHGWSPSPAVVNRWPVREAVRSVFRLGGVAGAIIPELMTRDQSHDAASYFLLTDAAAGLSGDHRASVIGVTVDRRTAMSGAEIGRYDQEIHQHDAAAGRDARA